LKPASVRIPWILPCVISSCVRPSHTAPLGAMLHDGVGRATIHKIGCFQYLLSFAPSYSRRCSISKTTGVQLLRMFLFFLFSSYCDMIRGQGGWHILLPWRTPLGLALPCFYQYLDILRVQHMLSQLQSIRLTTVWVLLCWHLRAMGGECATST